MSDVLLLEREVRRDIAAGLDAPQARWLVDYYYAVQDYRIQAAGQARAVAQDADQGTVELASHISGNMEAIEAEIQKALGEYAKASIPGQWALAQHGIGPVLAAGLLAHIDIEKAPTVGHIWRFAGLDPTVKWGKGEKRPWNASLKVLCCVPGQRVTTRRGAIEIENIAIGDEVLTHLGRWRRVSRVMQNDYIGNVHKVVARKHGGVGPILTDDHPVLVTSYELQELSEGWKRRTKTKAVAVATTTAAIAELTESGQSGRQVAASLGLSEATVSLYKAGKRKPGVESELGWRSARTVERGRDDVLVPRVPVEEIAVYLAMDEYHGALVIGDTVVSAGRWQGIPPPPHQADPARSQDRLRFCMAGRHLPC